MIQIHQVRILLQSEACISYVQTIATRPTSKALSQGLWEIELVESKTATFILSTKSLFFKEKKDFI